MITHYPENFSRRFGTKHQYTFGDIEHAVQVLQDVSSCESMRLARLEAGMSQQQVETYLGISSIQRYEQPKRVARNGTSNALSGQRDMTRVLKIYRAYNGITDEDAESFRRDIAIEAKAVSKQQLANLRPKECKRVTQYMMNGRELRTFDSMADASRQTGVGKYGISKTCRGVQKSAGGYKWKYA